MGVLGYCAGCVGAGCGFAAVASVSVSALVSVASCVAFLGVFVVLGSGA